MLRNGTGKGEIALGVGTDVRMTAHCQQLKNDDRQSERIVIGRAQHAAKVQPLELWRRIFRHADAAKTTPLALDNLKAIRIDKSRNSLVRDQHPGMIDVTDDAASLVNGSDTACRVQRCVGEEAVAPLGE